MNSQLLRVGDQRLEGLHRPEVMINREVVTGVVLVIGWCLENRVQIQDVDAQAVNVVELLDDALKVAAVEIAAIDRPVPRRIGPVLVKVDGDVSTLGSGLWIIGLVAVVETVGENLIDHCFVHPGRHLEGFEIDGQLVGNNISVVHVGLTRPAAAKGAVVAVPLNGVAGLHAEVIAEDAGLGGHRQLDGPYLAPGALLFARHSEVSSSGAAGDIDLRAPD